MIEDAEARYNRLKREKLRVDQLICLLQLYNERQTLGAAYPSGQLHSLLHEVFYMVHCEIMGASLTREKLEQLKEHEKQR